MYNDILYLLHNYVCNHKVDIQAWLGILNCDTQINWHNNIYQLKVLGLIVLLS